MASDSRKRKPRYTEVRGVDPYVDWSFGAGRSSFFLKGRQQRWTPVLLLAVNTEAQDFADGKGFIGSDEVDRWKASVRLSTLYQPPKAAEEGIRFLTAFVTEEFFAFLERNKALQERVLRLTLGLPLDTEPGEPSPGGSSK